jgi:hypothetical protein
MKRIIVTTILLLGAALARGQGNAQIQEKAGNSFLMDDNFEYSVTDYGVGQFQVRPADKENSLSPQVFWVKIRVLNKAEHSIQTPRYFAPYNPIRVTDNWGNHYLLVRPGASEVGGNWHGATLPIPDAEESKGAYKPGELSWDLRIIHQKDFVDGVTELRIYLVGHEFNNPKSCYFKIAQPFARQQNLLRDQADPEPSELQVKLVTETLQAPVTKRKH